MVPMLGADTYVPSGPSSGHRLPQCFRTGTGYMVLVFSVISSCWSSAHCQIMGYPEYSGSS